MYILAKGVLLRYLHSLEVNFTHVLEQLLQAKILKVQKNTGKLSVFFALLGSAGVKAALKMLMK
jgi:hypothetical protein